MPLRVVSGCAAAGGCRLSLPAASASRLSLAGNAGVSFPEKSGKPKTPAALMYGGWGRVLFGGSKRVSALPTGLVGGQDAHAAQGLA